MGRRPKKSNPELMVCELPAKTGPNHGNPTRGTYAGYRRHLRHDEPPCPECADAQRAYRSERYKLRKPIENQQAKEWANAHPNKVREYSRKWVAANRDRHRRAVRAAYWRNRDAYRAAARKRYRKNRDSELKRNRRYRRENREKIAAYTRQHQLDNPEVWREIARRRKARKQNAAITEFTPAQLEERLSMFAGCWMCGGDADTVDHVKPLAQGS